MTKKELIQEDVNSWWKSGKYISKKHIIDLLWRYSEFYEEQERKRIVEVARSYFCPKDFIDAILGNDVIGEKSE